MRDKVEFTFVDETGLCRKHYIGYDYTKAGSCCGIQVLADIHIAEWRFHEDEGEENGWYSTMSYRNISKELKLEAFKFLKDYIEGDGHKRSWSAGMVVLCDYVKMRGNNRATFLTREFAEWDDWDTDGLAVKNPNSQYHVQLWSKYIGKVKVNPHYVVNEVNEVTNESLANA
tara:strand:+ start:181 stop:696 length:516 start_codon:yes stop_codon:yes gene_type:complete